MQSHNALANHFLLASLTLNGLVRFKNTDSRYFARYAHREVERLKQRRPQQAANRITVSYRIESGCASCLKR